MEYGPMHALMFWGYLIVFFVWSWVGVIRLGKITPETRDQLRRHTYTSSALFALIPAAAGAWPWLLVTIPVTAIWAPFALRRSERRAGIDQVPLPPNER